MNMHKFIWHILYRHSNSILSRVHIGIRFFGFYFWVLLLLGLFACTNQIPDSLSPPGGRTFWALKFRDRGQKQSVVSVPAVFVGQNEYVSIYTELANPVPESHIDRIIAASRNIVQTEHSIFGLPLNINKDNRVVFLLLDIDDEYHLDPDNGSFAGYFDSNHNFKDSAKLQSWGIRSNETEMLFLDTNPLDTGSNDFLSTLAHEYQHLLHFSKNYRNNTNEAVWVNEGLSEVTSDVVGYGPQNSRVEGFSKKDNRPNSLIQWDSYLSDYNHVYVYFRYLVDIYGISVLTEIFNTKEESHKGVEKALAMKDPTGNQCSGASYTHFECSYRNFWASVLGLTDYSDSIRGATAPNLSGAFPSNKKLTSIAPVVHKHTYSASGLKGMAFKVFKKAAGTKATFSSVQSSFTLLQKESADHFVIFNHTTSGNSTFYNVNASFMAPRSGVMASFHRAEGSAPESPGPRKLHFHPSLSKEKINLLELVRHENDEPSPDEN